MLTEDIENDIQKKQVELDLLQKKYTTKRKIVNGLISLFSNFYCAGMNVFCKTNFNFNNALRTFINSKIKFKNKGIILQNEIRFLKNKLNIENEKQKKYSCLKNYSQTQHISLEQEKVVNLNDEQSF